MTSSEERLPREYIVKGWTYDKQAGEGCQYKMFAKYDPGGPGGDCPWRWNIIRNGVRYCGVHDPVARAKRNPGRWG